MDIREYKDRLQQSTRHPWEDARARFITDLVGSYFPQETGSVRLLDFGCGDGFVGRNLIRRYSSIRVVGVDSEIHQLNLVGGHDHELPEIEYFEKLEDYRAENGSLDGALLLDVLEHIDDDESFLQWFLTNRLFSEQAKFVITCPAFGKLFSNHDILLHHFRRYSLSELRAKVEHAGGGILESGYIFFIPLALRIVEVLLEKTGIIGKLEKTHISTWGGGRRATSAISGMLYYDALLCRFLRRLPMAGLTCYIICRKRVS